MLLDLDREHGPGNHEPYSADDLRCPVCSVEFGRSIQHIVDRRQCCDAGNGENANAEEENGASEKSDVVEVMRLQLGGRGPPSPGFAVRTAGAIESESDDTRVPLRGSADDVACDGILSRYQTDRAPLRFFPCAAVKRPSLLTKPLKRLTKAARALLVHSLQLCQHAGDRKHQSADEGRDAASIQCHGRRNLTRRPEGQHGEEAVDDPDGAAEGEEEGDVEGDVPDGEVGEHALEVGVDLSEGVAGLRRRDARVFDVAVGDQEGLPTFAAVAGGPLVG